MKTGWKIGALALGGIVVAAAAMAACGDDTTAPQSTTYMAHMNGANEVPHALALTVAHDTAAGEHAHAAPAVPDPQPAIRESEQLGDGQRRQDDTGWRFERLEPRAVELVQSRRGADPTCRLRTVRGRIRYSERHPGWSMPRDRARRSRAGDAGLAPWVLRPR